MIPPPSVGSGVAPFAEGLSLLWTIPFVVLLLAIAVLPLAAHRWWERNRNRAIVAAACALPVLGLLLAERDRGGGAALGEALHEYVSFLCYLGSLYVVAGNIVIGGDVRATPRNNVLLLSLGVVLANVVGTTGASMLLIRPLLRINAARPRAVHVPVFFLFLVSNAGGCLTPLGDPPLFIGYLRGVPFAWTLGLWMPWLFLCGSLLAIFGVVDAVLHRREVREAGGAPPAGPIPIRVRGVRNVLWLGAILAAVLFLGSPWREAAMVVAALASLAGTPAVLRRENGFSWAPLEEVAILFGGIFVAMVPALQILQARAGELGLAEPWQFFVATGVLSSFLDNAPTYLAFLSVALGLPTEGIPAGERLVLGGPLAGTVVSDPILAAISLGAVFMGANTYIGNGPNFMVKSVAEGAGRRMPSFLGYLGWAVGILGPLYVLVVLLFLR